MKALEMLPNIIIVERPETKCSFLTALPGSLSPLNELAGSENYFKVLRTERTSYTY